MENVFWSEANQGVYVAAYARQGKFADAELPPGIRFYPQNQSDPAKRSLGVHRTTILVPPVQNEP